MKTGFYISGAGHGLLLLAMLFGGVFTWEDEEPALRVTEVSILTPEQFAALSVPQPEPAAPVVSPPPRRRPEPEPDPAPTPAPPEPPAPEAAPEPVAEAPPADESVPSPADRIAPTPTPEPAPEAEVAPDRIEAPDPAPAEDSAPPPPEPVTPTAPPETTTEIRPEPPTSAPEASPRPRRRPTPPPVAEATPDPDPAPTPEPATDPIADAVSEALSEDPAPAAPQGPPLTGGEREAMRLAVGACWNLGALSSDAMATVVVVGFDMGRDGKPAAGSIELLSHRGGTPAGAQQAFQAARRAILRCGVNGYDLPDEKYDHWKRIEITFNPEDMRWR